MAQYQAYPVWSCTPVSSKESPSLYWNTKPPPYDPSFKKGSWSSFLLSTLIIPGLWFKPAFHSPYFLLPPAWILWSFVLHSPLASQYLTLLFIVSLQNSSLNITFYQFAKTAAWHLMLISLISSYFHILTS